MSMISMPANRFEADVSAAPAGVSALRNARNRPIARPEYGLAPLEAAGAALGEGGEAFGGVGAGAQALL